MAITYEIRSPRGRVVEVYDNEARAKERIAAQNTAWGLCLRLFKVTRQEEEIAA